MSKTKNNSDNKPYYTQRNNKLKPAGACNVTSMVAALSAAGWPVEDLATKQFPQPEDALMNFILNDHTVEVQWKRIDPAGNYPPNEWHYLLALGTNLWLRANGLLPSDKTAVEFAETRTVNKIIQTIDDGGAAVMSGVFTAEGKKTIGHVVCIVGYNKNEDGSISSFIVDDSWGDYRTEYRNQKGNDVEMPFEDFVAKLRPCNMYQKMAHIVTKYKEC